MVNAKTGRPMWVTAWSNGQPRASGAGYGLRVARADRDRYFKRGWSKVQLLFNDGDAASVPLSESFWHGCTELRSRAIGSWLLSERLAPWPSGHPPTFSLNPLGGGRFLVSRAKPTGHRS